MRGLLRLAFLTLAAPAAASGQPVVSFVDVQAGPTRGGQGGLGAPIGIFGTGFGATRGGSRVLIGGREVASHLVWGAKNAANPRLDMIVVQPGPKVRGGVVTVEVGGKRSRQLHRFTPARGWVLAVAPGGKDGSGCAIASPCLTIQHAIGTKGHCFYISHGHRIRIVGNVGAGTPGYGVHIFDQERSSNDIKREITDVLVEGNVLSGSTERSGLIVAMGDEGRRGNNVAGVTIRGNTFTSNNFAGVAIGGNVSNVKITGNAFRMNGRQGVTIYDEPTIRNVLISGNLIDQRPGGPCRVTCEWYPVAHVQVGGAATGVRVRSNTYRPADRP